MSTASPPVQTGARIRFATPPKELPKRKAKAEPHTEPLKERKLTLLSRLSKWQSEMPEDSVSFLLSLVVHVILVLVLALLTTSLHTGLRPLQISTSEGELDTAALSSVTFDSAAMSLDSMPSATSTESVSEIKLNVSESEVQLAEVVAPALARDLSTKNWVPAASMAASSTSKSSLSKSGGSDLFAGSSLEGRSSGNRKGLALKNGGSKESEAAVDAALVWFAAHQAVDGSWSTDMMDKPCNGQCRHGTVDIGKPKRIAATGLALLCFLGAGHTHKEGDYKDVVYKAINYLTSAIKSSSPNVRDFRPTGRFLDDNSEYEMYEHGIAVLAMCEAYEMTGDSILRSPCDNGIDFIQRSQHPDGSWGYRPGTSGDLSIVGWQMMALKSVRKIGMKVRPEVIQRADKFLDSQQSDNGSYYGYRSTQKEACTTAIGLMLRLYRGWSRTDPRVLKGVQYIADLGPSSDGIYYNYYATQLLFHMKFEKWAQWNVLNRDYLVREQARDGHEKGSWYFGRSHFNQVGGRLYCTAMATLTLEVYYRFMPIYSEIEDDSFAL